MTDYSTGKYDLIVEGYDWGPGVNKIILYCENSLSEKKVQVEDFSVTTEIQTVNWLTIPLSLKNEIGGQKIKAAYPCDDSGNKIEGESSKIALELSVSPDNAFSNPFLYSFDMMNHWQTVYNFEIKNEKLNIFISELNKRICPEADQFSFDTSKTESITLSYAYWFPKKETEKKIPLVIWLHGMGEGGKDPYIALLGNKVVNLISPDVQNCFGETGACVLTPQADGFWMQTSDKKEMKNWISNKSETTTSFYTNALFNLIDNFVKNNPQIDKNRIYIGGCSNGGYMTINMLLQYPEYFAAAYPICEAYPDSRIDEQLLASLAKQHIWFTQSKDDRTVFPNSYAVPTVKRLLEAGAQDIHFTLWENVTDTTGLYKDANGNPFKYNGHFSWIYTLNNQCEENGQTIFQWLAAQSK
ncbi:MAG: prolyl oligopeptidase family serine peptidase [Treponema sp.]|nr:prolyl oligopeptidase family serine peptidase [Treponema sp.]